MVIFPQAKPKQYIKLSNLEYQIKYLIKFDILLCKHKNAISTFILYALCLVITLGTLIRVRKGYLYCFNNIMKNMIKINEDFFGIWV